MAMSLRIIALAVERQVFFRGEFAGVEPMRGTERDLHSEEIFSSVPVLGKKIVALMQADAIERQLLPDPFVNVAGQILRRDGLIDQGQDFVIQILVIELVSQ